MGCTFGQCAHVSSFRASCRWAFAALAISSMSVAQVDWPAYITIDPQRVELVNNFRDSQAAVKLGADAVDCDNLAKRFQKGAGPKQPKYTDTDGSYMKSQADEYFQRVRARKAVAEAEEAAQQAVVLCESLDANAKARKRAIAAKALAKRTPKNMKVAAGTFLTECD